MTIYIPQIRDHFLIVMHPMSKEMVAGAAGEGERKYQITLTISHATQSLQCTQRAVLAMPHQWAPSITSVPGIPSYINIPVFRAFSGDTLSFHVRITRHPRVSLLYSGYLTTICSKYLMALAVPVCSYFFVNQVAQCANEGKRNCYGGGRGHRGDWRGR